MKPSFNVVNALLVILIVAWVIFHYTTEHSNHIDISNYTEQIQDKQDVINDLIITNNVVDSSITVLSDSIVQLKELAIQQTDSIIYINVAHEKAIEEIRVLSDSLSVIQFRRSTSEHASRFGFNFD